MAAEWYDITEDRRPIARLAYLVETDTDATWYDFAVYTEKALEHELARLRRDYPDTKVTRYPAPTAAGRFSAYHGKTARLLGEAAVDRETKKAILAKLSELLDLED